MTTTISYVADEAQSWALANGLLMGSTHAPITLKPSKIPKSAYEKTCELAYDFNVLIDRVSRDHEFLSQTLSSVALVDDFINHLLNILRVINQTPGKKPSCLGLHRCDYMFERDQSGRIHPFQVEINTISAAFGCLTTLVTDLHQYLISRCWNRTNVLPSNSASQKIVDSLAHAVEHYRTHWWFEKNREPHILMVVQPNEKNSVDQRLIEYQLWDRYGLRLIRRSLRDISTSIIVSENDELFIDNHLIALVYYRAGYKPDDYESEDHWQSVLLMEQSHAIKCPSVGYHLAGSKKVQQTLALPGVLERFVEPERAERLRSCQVGLWGLEKDDLDTQTIINTAIADPDQFVLKPQREGGGNNLWGLDLANYLQTASVMDRSAYILMQRIRPFQQHGVLMRNGQVTHGLCCNELGIYSSYLSDGEKVYLDQVNGHLLRTKLADQNEGGVATGYAVLDSPDFT